MSRDRLAGLRAQNPTPSPAPSPPRQASPRPSGANNPFSSSQDDLEKGPELSEKVDPSEEDGARDAANPFDNDPNLNHPPEQGGDEMAEFFDEIGALQSILRDLSTQIDSLATYQSKLRSVPSTSSPQHATLTAQIEETSETIRTNSNKVKRSINSLNAETKEFAQTPGKITQTDVDLRLKQLGNVQRKFVELVQKHAGVEKRNRDDARSKLERQVRIVRPDASDDEVKQTVSDIATGKAGDVFGQALATSGSQRLGSAKNALSEVQRRQEEIQRIERTITELAQLFSDMAVMVDEQDVQIVAIEAKAEQIMVDIEQGHQELKVAKDSAKGARKKRVWCLVICVSVVVVLGIIVAVSIGHKK